MIALEGKFSQIKVDGKVYSIDDSMKIPFAMLTFFQADTTLELNGNLDYEQLIKFIDNQLPTKNIFYAIKISGLFKYVKARSVPKQEKPYPPITEAINKQAIFEFMDVNCTAVGFRIPDYFHSINDPGYHLHLITKDNKGGGHILQL